MFASNLKEWHQKICERENYVCRVCKKDFSYDHYFNENGVNQYLTGHHYPHTQKSRPDLVLSLDNGVSVCLECHTKAHKGLVEIPAPEKMKEEISPKKGKVTAQEPIVYDHVLPSGRPIRLRAGEHICKCKKYVAQEVSGVCMACEKRGPSNFKVEKKKK